MRNAYMVSNYKKRQATRMMNILALMTMYMITMAVTFRALFLANSIQTVFFPAVTMLLLTVFVMTCVTASAHGILDAYRREVLIKQ